MLQWRSTMRTQDIWYEEDKLDFAVPYSLAPRAAWSMLLRLMHKDLSVVLGNAQVEGTVVVDMPRVMPVSAWYGSF